MTRARCGTRRRLPKCAAIPGKISLGCLPLFAAMRTAGASPGIGQAEKKPRVSEALDEHISAGND
jgi:hypothetical protein